jgi:hypothetical protein
MLLVTATVVAIPTTLTAATGATGAQTCTGPGIAEQAGRQRIVPGINNLATVQTVTSKIRIVHCTGAPTGGSGTLITSLTTGPLNCASAFGTAHLWKATARIIWTNGATSTGKVTFTTSGLSRRAQVTGKLSAGLLAGHTLTGEYKWVPLISPGTQKFPAACDNAVAVNSPGRISVVGHVVYRVKAFTIT